MRGRRREGLGAFRPRVPAAPLPRGRRASSPRGGGRDLADSLYADLFGLQERDGQRRSLFRYFEGRSSLATWLRAVLAQRYVDQLRARRRLEPLPEDESDPQRPATRNRDRRPQGAPPDPDRPRYLALMRQALARALGAPRRPRSASTRLLLCPEVDARPKPGVCSRSTKPPPRVSWRGHGGRFAPSSKPSCAKRAWTTRSWPSASRPPSTTRGRSTWGDMLGAGAARKESAPDRSI